MSFSIIKQAFLWGLLCLVTACNSSPLKSDETVFFFPTSANLKDNSQWEIPIHHWVFEKEENSIGNKLAQKLLSEVAEAMDVPEEKADSEVFQQRLMWFLVDNERNKNIEIDINNTKQKLNPTAANGHARTSFYFPRTLKQGDWLSYKVVNTKDKRQFKGEIQLIPNTGLSVISDVDDTIKVSDVLDKKALIKNTFVEPYKITEGMPEYYKKLHAEGAYFHYVSASPWQLYPSLKPFMDEQYPQGTISLRDFRLKDSSIIKFLQSSADYKTTQIKNIIQRYPKHQFILIGDSGEHDPEVYAKIYNQFPAAIKSIQIRAVIGSDLSDERFRETFNQVPGNIWQLFSKPSEFN